MEVVGVDSVDGCSRGRGPCVRLLRQNWPKMHFLAALLHSINGVGTSDAVLAPP